MIENATNMIKNTTDMLGNTTILLFIREQMFVIISM